MKPKPLSALNHFTVPVAICSSPLSATTRPRRADREPTAARAGTGPLAPVMTFSQHQPSAVRANALPGHPRAGTGSWQTRGAAVHDDAHETAEQAAPRPPTDRSRLRLRSTTQPPAG